MARQVEKRVYGEDLLVQDLPDGTEQEFWFHKHDLQTMAHLVKKIPYHGRQLQ
jgi:DNA primase